MQLLSSDPQKSAKNVVQTGGYPLGAACNNRRECLELIELSKGVEYVAG